MNIGCIEYIDAYYGYEEIKPDSNFSAHEACGYISETDSVYIVEFLQQTQPQSKRIARGLLIPKGAIGSNSNTSKYSEEYIHALKGKQVVVIWDDITLVELTTRRTPSKMKTKGILHAVSARGLILVEPRTTRECPLPKKQHIEGDPTFIVIPKSLITSIRKVV